MKYGHSVIQNKGMYRKNLKVYWVTVTCGHGHLSALTQNLFLRGWLVGGMGGVVAYTRRDARVARGDDQTRRVPGRRPPQGEGACGRYVQLGYPNHREGYGGHRAISQAGGIDACG